MSALNAFLRVGWRSLYRIRSCLVQRLQSALSGAIRLAAACSRQSANVVARSIAVVASAAAAAVIMMTVNTVLRIGRSTTAVEQQPAIGAEQHRENAVNYGHTGSRARHPAACSALTRRRPLLRAGIELLADTVMRYRYSIERFLPGTVHGYWLSRRCLIAAAAAAST